MGLTITHTHTKYTHKKKDLKLGELLVGKRNDSMGVKKEMRT